MSLSQENSDINKNILNRITYLINKRLSNFNLNKIDNIYENTKTLLNEFDKQNIKLNNKITVLENLITLMNKEINDVKKKLKNHKQKDSSDDNKISNKFEDNIDNIDNIDKKEKKNKIKNIDDENNEQLNASIEIKKTSSFSSDINYKELKKEEINIDYEFVKKCLEAHNINSDIKIFKKIYIDEIPNSYYPIRHLKGNYQYWLNNKFNVDDESANYIKDTLIHNITNLYLHVNIMENYKDDTVLFIKNQEYIFSLSKSKYKDKFLKNILKIIEY